MFYLRQNGAQPPLSLRDLQISEPETTSPCFRHVYVGQDNPAVLIFVNTRKQRGGKRPMSAIVKHTATNPVNTEGRDEKSCFNNIL